MKNRRNIVEQKYPPENPNDIWLKDGKFYRSTSEGWVVIDSEIEYASKESMIIDNPKGGTIGINKVTGEASIYNDVTKEWNPLGGGGGGMTETTWQELKDKRDNGKLIPGSLYRITDYNCTTTQENTQSAGHQFDIVLLALSEDKLAEEGWAMMNESNIYDVTFSDGVTKKCYIYIDRTAVEVVDIDTMAGIDAQLEEVVINEDTKTATISLYTSTDLDITDLPYNYFQNSNLSAWKVWYCLDNDTARFAWADSSMNDKAKITSTIMGSEITFVRDIQSDIEISNTEYYAWTKESLTKYTLSETPQVNDTLYNNDGSTYNKGHVESYVAPTNLPNGKGVIYRLIDEWGNDCPYDFKNILYVVREQMFAYTFSAMGESPTDPIFDASIKLASRIRYNSISIYDIENNTLPNIQFVITASDASVKFNSIIDSGDDVIVCSYAHDNILRNCHLGTYQMEEMNGLTFWNCEHNYSTIESPFYIFDAPVQINFD